MGMALESEQLLRKEQKKGRGQGSSRVEEVMGKGRRSHTIHSGFLLPRG